jgi:hypothetical protein
MCNCNKKCNCEKKEKKEKLCKLYDYLTGCETILFEGSYNLEDITYNNATLVTIPYEISINKCGSNIGVTESIYVKDKTQNNLQLLYETYTLSSYKKEYSQSVYDNKIGEITWNGFYPNSGTNTDTTSSFQQFVVLGGSGIYTKVKKIVIDFRNSIRKIYFIGKK